MVQFMLPSVRIIAASQEHFETSTQTSDQSRGAAESPKEDLVRRVLVRRQAHLRRAAAATQAHVQDHEHREHPVDDARVVHDAGVLDAPPVVQLERRLHLRRDGRVGSIWSDSVSDSFCSHLDLCGDDGGA